jgi:hypothetical protein
MSEGISRLASSWYKKIENFFLTVSILILNSIYQTEAEPFYFCFIIWWGRHRFHLIKECTPLMVVLLGHYYLERPNLCMIRAWSIYGRSLKVVMLWEAVVLSTLSYEGAVPSLRVNLVLCKLGLFRVLAISYWYILIDMLKGLVDFLPTMTIWSRYINYKEHWKY